MWTKIPSGRLWLDYKFTDPGVLFKSTNGFSFADPPAGQGQNSPQLPVSFPLNDLQNQGNGMHVQQAKNRQAHSQLQRLCVLKPGEFKRPCPCDKTALPEPPTHRENVSSTSKPQISWLFKANRTASHQAHVCEFLLRQAIRFASLLLHRACLGLHTRSHTL